jgi:hypothetical protein
MVSRTHWLQRGQFFFFCTAYLVEQCMTVKAIYPTTLVVARTGDAVFGITYVFLVGNIPQNGRENFIQLV